jgi:hypothetical protein
MSRPGVVALLLGCEVVSLMTEVASAGASRLHTSESFRFTVAAPLSVAFPLFGAAGERRWAPDWQPVFVWPSEQADRTGMVFMVAHGDRQGIWANTELDPIGGRIQYVYVLPEVMTTVITLRLRERQAETIVQVRY